MKNMNTKEKILKESLRIFNENSFELSTTNMIAAESKILEGSLWYHFNSKFDIVSGHLDMFIELFNLQKKHTENKNYSIFIQGLFSIYEIIWDFRYLFRDSFQKISKKKPKLFKRINETNNLLDQLVKESVIHAKNNGIIIIDESDIDNIVEISLIIGRYWFDFSKQRYSSKSSLFLRKKGVNLLIKSFYPYLSDESKEHIDSIYEPN